MLTTLLPFAFRRAKSPCVILRKVHKSRRADDALLFDVGFDMPKSCSDLADAAAKSLVVALGCERGFAVLALAIERLPDSPAAQSVLLVPLPAGSRLMPILAGWHCLLQKHGNITSRPIPMTVLGVLTEMPKGWNTGQVFNAVIKRIAVDVVDMMLRLDAAMMECPHRPMKVAIFVAATHRGEVVAAL
jgi:hypothetical protein